MNKQILLSYPGMGMNGVIILLTLCLYVGCSSPDASHATKPNSSVTIQQELMDRQPTTNKPSIVFENGSNLYAERISLVSLQNGGHELYAENWTTSNGLARGMGSTMKSAFGAGWDVRVCQGTLSVTNESALRKFGDKDSGMGVYQVHSHDTLTNIAVRMYGDASAWQGIYDANQALLQDGGLKEGMVISIPSSKKPEEMAIEILTSEGSEVQVRLEIVKKDSKEAL